MIPLRFPVIQAPMAGGISTIDMAVAVADFGGLGMIAAGYSQPGVIRSQIRELKSRTDGMAGVNLFVPQPFQLNEEILLKAKEGLHKWNERFGVAMPADLPDFGEEQERYKQLVQVVLEERVPVCSFTFGVPDKRDVHRLKTVGITVVGTATTLEEARVCEAIGMQAIVLQGTEAGGHRGSFSADEPAGKPLRKLLAEVKREISVPLIASGGIMSGQGVKDNLENGAIAVQLGTYFLAAEESGASAVYKQAVLNQRADTTSITKAFSGRWARGVENDFMKAMKDAVTAPFPIQNTLTQELRKAAARQESPQAMSLWAGTGVSQVREATVNGLLVSLQKEM